MMWELARMIRRKRARGSNTHEFTRSLCLDEVFSRSRRLDLRSPSAIPKIGKFSVTYVLDRLVIAGGTLSVIQLVNELILQGVDARIACRFEDPAVYRWLPFLTRPMVFRSLEELALKMPETDIAVATLWNTAGCVKKLKSLGKARETAYFLQDYEPWFFPKNHTEKRKRVLDTYELIGNKIVKSNWLLGKLEQLGHSAKKIPLGLDLETFRPSPNEQKQPSIIAMARPGTKHRGFDRLREVLGIVKAHSPGVEVRLFGSSQLRSRALGFDYKDLGVIENQQELARAYRTSLVFIDTSDFQGFGRCGLEAMACGTAAVLTGSGGVTEYATNENCILVKPDSKQVAEAVLKLLSNSQLANQLTAKALEDVERFSAIEEARRTERFFSQLVNMQ